MSDMKRTQEPNPVRNFIRARFSREYPVRYTSHLDMIRMFNRTFRRAGLPVAWSQGFNPHPVMTFALPLAVGVTSDSEVVEIGMERDLPPEEFMERMNQDLPGGFRISSCAASAGKGLMASVGAASYIILCGSDPSDEPAADFICRMKQAAGRLMKTGHLPVEKKEDRDGRKASKMVDIRPMIFQLDCMDQGDGNAIVRLLSAAGSVANLRPDLLVKALDHAAGGNFQVMRIHRSGLYARRKDGLVDLLAPELLAGTLE